MPETGNDNEKGKKVQNYFMNWDKYRTTVICFQGETGRGQLKQKNRGLESMALT